MSKKNEDAYRDNIRIKKAGAVIKYTEEQIQEYIKCSKDPIHFARNYMKIVNVDSGLILFDMYDFQEDMVRLFKDNRFVILKCPRQSGKSLTTIAYLLWLTIFHSDKNVALLANKGQLAREILSRYQLAYENLPLWLQQGVLVWNKGNVELENGSKVMASATSSSAIRGSSFNCVTGEAIVQIMDEFGNIKSQPIEQLYNSQENIKNTGKLKILSENNIFRDFKFVSRKKSNKIIELYFDDGTYIHVTEDHKILCNNIWMESKNIKVGDSVQGTTNLKKVIYKCKSNISKYVYDIVHVDLTHNFFANQTLIKNCVLMDELAHVPTNIAHDFFNSVYPVISSGKTTQIIIVSTPLGMNLYYKLWMDAINKRNNYIPYEVFWDQVPGRDESFKEETIRNTNERQWAQEYSCEFLGSSNTLLSGKKLQEMVYRDPIIDYDFLKIYYKPVKVDGDEVKKDHLYIITVDISEGRNLDSSAFCVFDISQTPYEQVAAYKNPIISPLLFPTIIYNTAKFYNDAFILVELNNNPQVADIIHQEFEYENLLKVFTGNKQPQNLSAGFARGIQLGVKMSVIVKKVGCANLKTLIEGNKLIINDFDTYSEFTTFINHKTSFAAEAGSNDDLVMCCVIFAWASTQKYFREIVSHDIRKQLQIEHLNQYDEDLLPPPIMDNGLNPKFEILDDDMWELADGNECYTTLIKNLLTF